MFGSTHQLRLCSNTYRMTPLQLPTLAPCRLLLRPSCWHRLQSRPHIQLPCLCLRRRHRLRLQMTIVCCYWIPSRLLLSHVVRPVRHRCGIVTLSSQEGPLSQVSPLCLVSCVVPALHGCFTMDPPRSSHVAPTRALPQQIGMPPLHACVCLLRSHVRVLRSEAMGLVCVCGIPACPRGRLPIGYRAVGL